MKTLSKPLLLSLIFNIVLFCSVVHYIQKQGGLGFFKKFSGNNDVGSDPYYQVKNSLFTLMPANKNEEILFIGDSLTDYCDWYELMGNNNIRNRGIAGDFIEGVSRRLDEALKSRPKKIFLMIGINNLVRVQNSPAQVLKAYEDLMTSIKVKSPLSVVYIESILPVNGRLEDKNLDIVAINSGLVALTKRYNFQYINLHDSFLDKNNVLNSNYSEDGLHLNGKGYLVWKAQINNFVNE